MSSSPIAQALKEIAEAKGLEYEVVLNTLETALAAAYRKDFGEKNQNVIVQFNPETGAMRASDVKMIVEDQELPPEGEELPLPQQGEGEEEVKRFNPKTEIMISEAHKIKPDAQLGEIISTELAIPAEFGRMAAQTAKQVITQKLREAERNAVYSDYKTKEHTIVVGTIGRREPRHILIDIGRGTGILPIEEQVPSEEYRAGARMKMYVVSVAMTTKGPEIILSRAHSELIRDVFENEIPEIASGVVQIKSIAREAGSRAKVAVYTDDSSIDPVGSCIGQRGTRIQTIIAELGGEKIDLIVWSQDPKEFITQALAPAKVLHVTVSDQEKLAVVTVPADQLSLAIGRGGQNVRLAARLTGWKINVRDEKESIEGERKAVGEDARTSESGTPQSEMQEVDMKSEAQETTEDIPKASDEAPEE